MLESFMSLLLLFSRASDVAGRARSRRRHRLCELVGLYVLHMALSPPVSAWLHTAALLTKSHRELGGHLLCVYVLQMWRKMLCQSTAPICLLADIEVRSQYDMPHILVNIGSAIGIRNKKKRGAVVTRDGLR